ncbi:MAG: glycosyltransferase family 1 protein [Bacteroidota bacterium]
MRIAVNTRLLLKGKLEGIGWVEYETLKRITKSHPEHEFVFLFDREYDDEFLFSDNITPVILGPQTRHPLLWYWWFEHSIVSFLKKYKADIFVSPDSYGSLRLNIPQLITFHDIAFEHNPKDIPPVSRRFYRKYFPLYAKKAKRIISVSEHTKKDLIDLYKIDSDKIDVVYNGANERYTSLTEDEKNLIKKEITSGNDFFIFVGSLHPRKNISNLFRAYDQFRKENECSIKLVIVGDKLWNNFNLEKIWKEMQFKDDVIFTGRLETRKLHQVLGSALALTYVSFYEGFGIPIVEAFGCDVPVITSNTSSMPEVAGDAALLTDPSDYNSISAAMKKIAFDPALRNELIARGRGRRPLFNWDESARGLWNAILKTVEV